MKHDFSNKSTNETINLSLLSEFDTCSIALKALKENRPLTMDEKERIVEIKKKVDNIFKKTNFRKASKIISKANCR